MGKANALSPSTKPARWVWPDLAKAVCIVLVVFQHVVQRDGVAAAWQVPSAVTEGWQQLSRWFLPLRMPLFFAISGFFASQRVRTRSWAETRRAGLVRPYYLYLVWTSVLSALYLFGPWCFQRERELASDYHVHDVDDYFGALAVGYTSTWYLYALALYFLLTKALGRFGRAVGFAVPVGLALAAAWLPSRGNAASLWFHAPFYAFGALFPSLLGRLAAQAQRRPVLAVCGAGALFAAVTALNGLVPRGQPALALPVSFAALGCAALLFAALPELLPRLSRKVAALGARTLEIYVLHLPLREVLLWSLESVPVAEWSAPLPWLLGGSLPLWSTALLVAASIGLRRGLEWLGVGFLFSLPREPTAVQALRPG